MGIFMFLLKVHAEWLRFMKLFYSPLANLFIKNCYNLGMKKFNNLSFIVLLVFMFKLTLFSLELNTTINLTEKEKNFIQKHPTIRVHNEMNWPPFNFNKDATPMGLSIEYMNILASRVGIDIEYISGPTWNEFLEGINKKELDVMLNIVKTPIVKNILFLLNPI